MVDGSIPSPAVEEYATIESGAARVFVRVRDVQGARGFIVLVHGLSDHSGRFERVVGALNAAGLSTWALDLRGHGRTDGRRGVVHSFTEFLDDIDSIRTAARARNQGLEFVLGHSMGGLAVLRYIQTHIADRPTGAVVVAPFTAVRIAIPRWKRVLGVAADRVLPGLALDDGIREEDLFRIDEEVDRRRRDPLVHHKISARLWAEMVRNAGLLADEVTPDVPVLFQIPGDDRVVSSPTTEALIRGRFPDADVRRYDDAFHDLYSDPVGDQAITDAVRWIETMMNTVTHEEN